MRHGMTATVAGIAERRVATPGTEWGFRDGATAWALVGDFDRPLLIIDEDVG